MTAPQCPAVFLFAGAFFYNETATYIGIIAVVLALVGVLIGVRGRRPAAIALAVVGVVLAAVEWVGPVSKLVNELPVLDLSNWLRAFMPLALVIATLAGIGTDGLLRKEADALDRIALGGAFGLAALLTAALWVFGRTANNVPTYFRALVEHEHTASFLWPVIAIVIGLVVSGLLWWRPCWSTAGLSILIGTEVLSSLVAGSVLIASSPDGYPATAAVQQLQRIVGNARLGTGEAAGAGASCPLGILPDANILFGVHQVNMNEPIMPKKYYSTWEAQNHSVPGAATFSQFCPLITTAAQAWQLGVSYVLVSGGAPGPMGTTYITKLRVPNPHPSLPGETTTSNNEDMYFVPASGIVTLSTRPLGGLARRPAAYLRVSSTSSGGLNVIVHQKMRGTLNLHVSDVPGWHASIDGKPLALRASSEFDLQADIPGGSHDIKLEYWPALFSAGLIIAAIAVLGIGCAISVTWLRTRRRRPTEATG